MGKNLFELIKQPAFARVVVSDKEEQKHIFYVSRRSPVGICIEHEAKLVSYQNPIGRLASLPVGDEEKIEYQGQDQYFEVLETSNYCPIQ